MDCIYTNDMIDEIGEGLIRKFDYSAYSSGQAVDIGAVDKRQKIKADTHFARICL